jgi:hypothetical protein
MAKQFDLIVIGTSMAARVGEAAWERAVYDAGLFFDQWGSLAIEFQWTPGDLFDMPHDAKTGGLI